METELLSVHDITRILSISRVAARRWCCDPRLPAAKIDKSYRIRKEDLGKWCQGKLVDHTIAEH